MTTNELRCKGRIHGILSDDHSTIEVKCPRSSCGARKGVVVLHTFDLTTGELINTKKYKDPQKGLNNGSVEQRTAVRSS